MREAEKNPRMTRQANTGWGKLYSNLESYSEKFLVTEQPISVPAIIKYVKSMPAFKSRQKKMIETNIINIEHYFIHSA